VTQDLPFLNSAFQQIIPKPSAIPGRTIRSSSYSLLKARNFKTVITPTAPDLIADTVVGGAITVEIAFLDLNGFDQFSLEKVIVFNTV
jgi:hypothetical protein